MWCIIVSLRKQKKEILTHATTWMNLEDIMLSEICQIQKDKYHMVPHDDWSNSYGENVKHGCQELRDWGNVESPCDSWKMEKLCRWLVVMAARQCQCIHCQ